jgi:hypothetical protein
MQKTIVTGGVVGALMVLGLALVGSASNAGETVLIRGIVLQRDGNVINVNYKLVAQAGDKTRWQGLACDVNVGNAKRYVWENRKGVLTRVRTTSVPTPGEEVVFMGTISDDCRVSASWVVQNYRQYTLTGKLQGIKFDTGKTDAGFVTVNVSKLVMRGIVPERKFKEAQFKGVDLIVRFNALTDFTALGKSKQADEVTAGQQSVVIEGAMNNENFVASKLKEQ